MLKQVQHDSGKSELVTQKEMSGRKINAQKEPVPRIRTFRPVMLKSVSASPPLN
jgi:hypothetical protein